MAKTTVSFLLDRTGSMQQIKNDVIGGFNQFLAKQKAEPGKCRFIFTIFDSQSIDTLHDGDVREAPELTQDTYIPRASTPLLDAIAKTIAKTEESKPKGRILFVVYTDGYENASREHTNASVKQLVEAKQKDGWDFMFLGADIDAYDQANKMGIRPDMAFATVGSSTPQTMSAVADSVSGYRSGGPYDQVTANLRVEEERQKKEKKKRTT